METKDMHEMKDNGDIHKLDPAPQHRISSSPCTSSSSVLSHSSPRHHIMIGSDFVNQEILSLLSRWNGLQMAIKNSWGGCESQHKYDQLIEDVISMFARSEGRLCPNDVENFLHESLLLSFNTEIEDGSIEEVAEQLTFLYEDYLRGSHHH